MDMEGCFLCSTFIAYSGIPLLLASDAHGFMICPDQFEGDMSLAEAGGLGGALRGGEDGEKGY